MPTISKISNPEDYSISIKKIASFSNYEEMFFDCIFETKAIPSITYLMGLKFF